MTPQRKGVRCCLPCKDFGLFWSDDPPKERVSDVVFPREKKLLIP